METINKLRQLIKQEQSNKKENKIALAHVTLLFVVDKIKASKEDIMAAAKKLEQSGAIKIGRTINDYYFQELSDLS